MSFSLPLFSTEQLLEKFLNCEGGICTDTRSIQKHSFFVCLRGENFNGNAFADEALRQGAKYVVIDDQDYLKDDDRYLLVEHTLTSLQALATLYRQNIISSIPLVIIAGSNGKTTTKELCHSIIAQQYKTYCTPSNLNNHIGVPINILRIQKWHERAIIEIGANHLGEHQVLCEIAQADVAIVLNCGKDHLEGYGGVDGVVASANEVISYALKQKMLLLLNADDEKLMSLDQHQSAKLFGDEQKIKKDRERYIAWGKVLSSFPSVDIMVAGKKMTSHLIGAFQLYNLLASISLAKLWGVNDEHIQAGLQHYQPKSNRGQLISWQGNQVLLDAYNANPSSMQAIIQEMSTLPHENKVLICGDMAELGEYAHQEHQNILNSINPNLFKEVLLIGQHFFSFKNQYPSFHFFEERNSAREWLLAQKWTNHFILLKGSRSMALEKILDF